MTIRYSIYARVSEPSQAKDDKQSIPGQIATCREYAARHGLEETAVYCDPGLTGEEFEGRPEFVKCMRDAKAGRFDVLLVAFGDRISRKTYITTTFFHELTSAGVQIIDLFKRQAPPIDPSEFKKRGPRGHVSELIETTFTGLMSEIDQSQRIERSVRARRAYTAQGKFLYAAMPFGYREIFTGRGERQPEPDPATYPLLEELPALVLQEHLSDRAIAERWNRLGYRTARGSVISGAFVARLRANPFYAGLVTYGRTYQRKKENGKITVYTNKDEATITYGKHEFVHPWSPETFDAMRQVKQGRAEQGGRAVASGTPLVGVLKCGYCQNNMIFTGYFKTPYGKRHTHSYVCGLFVRSGECQRNQWSVQRVWKEVVHELEYKLPRLVAEAQHDLDRPAEALPKPQATLVNALSVKLDEAKAELEDLPQQRLQVHRAWQRRIIRREEDYILQQDDLEKREAELLKRIAELETEIAETQTKTNRLQTYQSVFEAWQAVREETLQTLDKWPAPLIQDVKFKIIQPLFAAITVKEPDGGSPRNGSRQKLLIEVSFVYRV